MILETFVMKYVADTREAAVSLDLLDKKGKDVQTTLTTGVKGAAEDLGSSIKNAMEGATQGADGASDSARGLAGSYDDAGEAAKKAGDKARKAHKDAADAANAEADANKKLSESASKRHEAEGNAESSRISKIGQKFKSMLKSVFDRKQQEAKPGEGGSGGGIGSGLSKFAGGVAGEGRTLVGGVAGALPGGPGMIGLIGAASAAAAAVTVFAKVIGIANEQAEKAIHLRETAWKAGMTETQYNAAVIRGKRMGATEEEVRSSREGLAAKVRSAKAQPYGEEAFWMRRAGIKTGGGRDIENITKQVLNHARQLAKTKGEAEGIAWATQRMGMSFAEASRYVSMTDQQLKQYNQSTLAQEVDLAVAQRRAKAYGDAKREMDNVMEQAGIKVSRYVTPSLTNLAKVLKHSAEQSDGVVSGIGKMSAALVDFTAFLIDQADGLLGYLNKRGAGLGEALAEPEMIEALAKATGKPAEQIRLERQSQGIGLGWMFTEESRKEAMREALDELRAKYPESAPSLKSLPLPGGGTPGFGAGARAPSLVIGKSEQERMTEDRLYKPRAGGSYGDAEAKAIEDAKKMQAAGTLDRPLEDVINEIHKMAAQAESDAEGPEETNAILADILKVAIKQTNIVDAQAKHLMPPIPVQPIDIGLEQAMSLWASGIGKAAGLIGPEGAAAGGSRAEFEAVARQQMEAKRYVGFQPAALVGSEATKSAIMGGRDAAKGVASAQVSSQLSLNQNNTFNVTVSESDAGRRVSAAIRQSNDSANRAMVNSWADRMTD